MTLPEKGPPPSEGETRPAVSAYGVKGVWVPEGVIPVPRTPSWDGIDGGEGDGRRGGVGGEE